MLDFNQNRSVTSPGTENGSLRRTCSWQRTFSYVGRTILSVARLGNGQECPFYSLFNSSVRLRCGLAVAFVALASCSFGPAAVEPPSIDPADAGSAAMELYDANSDGVVSAGELDRAPGLTSALKRIDANGDGGASADEVAVRIEKWQETAMGLTSFGFTVTLDGRPLDGAAVIFEPESFLGKNIKAATATTDMFGTGGPSIPKDERPTPATPPGIQLGLYRVKISKQLGGKELIPPRYNVQTILGQEVAPDVPEIANRRVVYALTSK